MNRRHFLAASAAAALPLLAQRATIRKAVLQSMLPKGMPLADGFQFAKQIGFEEIECFPSADPKQVEEIRAASEKSGLRIHSVLQPDFWKYPLSSPDPAVVAKGQEALDLAIRNADTWKADTVLVVPAVVTPQTSYRDAYERSQASIRKLVPLATEKKVTIAIEEVWNKFLLSPLEFARYIDEFKSPYVKAYFDVGNVVLYAYPQDWIRTLGPRIAKLHIKDFKWTKAPGVSGNLAQWVPLQEGDIDWKEIRKALDEIGYKGTATLELPGGDGDALKENFRRFTAIVG